MKVLIAEDDAVSRKLVESHLKKWGYDAVVAADGAEAWTVLQGEDAPRLALLDWMMPGLDGVRICRRVRERVHQPYVYIVLLTSRGNKEDIIVGLESGANDYLTKPFHVEELKARLRAGARILELQDRLTGMNESLQFRATHDSLMGLWNRGAILDILERELLRGQREAAPVGVLLADLDRFKMINDTYGHLVGDEVLRESARRFTTAVRAYDSVGRYGGEEFVVVLPGCDDATARARAEQICAAIRSSPVDTPRCSVRATISVGVASTGGRREADADELLRAADAALYRAKQQGRDRVMLADDEAILNVGRRPPQSF